MKAGAVAVAVLGMLAVTPAAGAMTVFPMEHTCPLGGERFTQDTVMSGTAFGHYLDGRGFGPIASPWPLVECPGNGFPIYRHDFSKAELGQLAPLIASDAYQRMRKDETQYWRLGWLLEQLQAPLEEQAAVLRQATWEASPEQYPRYVAAASGLHARLCPEDAPQQDLEWIHCQAMLGEWERRGGRLDEARDRFQRLQPLLPGEASSAEEARRRTQLAAEVEQQLGLVEAGNTLAVLAVDAFAPERQGEAPAVAEGLAPGEAASEEEAWAAVEAALAAATAAADAAAAATAEAPQAGEDVPETAGPGKADPR